MKITLFVCAFLLSATLHAQRFDNPVEIPITYYGEAVEIAVSPASFSFGITSNTQSSKSISNTPGGTHFFSDPVLAYVKPGVTYKIDVVSTNCATVYVNFPPVPGCEIYLDGYKSSNYTHGTNYQFTLRVEKINDITQSLAGKRGGDSSSFSEDKPIWYVGLGSLRNGRFAGAVGFRADSITTGLFGPGALVYDSVDPSEVSVIRDPGNQHITEVHSGAVVLKMTTLTTTSFKIDVSLPETPTVTFITYTISQYTGSGGGIRIDKLEDGVNWSTVLQNSGSTWTLYDWRVATAGSAINTSNAITTTVNSSTQSTVNYGIGTGQVVKQKNYTTVNNRKEVQSFVHGPGTTSAPSTTYNYYTTSVGTAWFGAVQSMSEPTGRWTKYDYYNGSNELRAGLVYRLYRPWLDAPTTPGAATTSNSYVETFDYTTSQDGSQTAPSSRIVTINGTTAGKTTWSYNWSYLTDVNGDDRVIARTVQSDYPSAAGTPLVTTTLSYREDDANSFLQGKLHSVVYANGTKRSFAYANGTWNASTGVFGVYSPGGARQLLTFHGNATSGGGASAVSSWNGWTMDTVYMVPDLSTISETVIDVHGRVVRTAEYVFVNASTIEMIAGTVFTFDSHGLLQKEKDLTRSVSGGEVATSHSHTAGLRVSTTDVDGVRTAWSYDNWLRNTTITTAADGSGSYPAKTQTFTYYSSNLKETARECDCSPTVTTYSYDSAGRPSSMSEPKPGGGTLVTSYSYPTLVQTTATLPTNATRTTTLYLDGRLKSETGTAQVNVSYDYALESGGAGNLVKTTKHGTTLGNGWLEEKTDWLGRTVTQRTPQVGWTSGSTKVVRKTFGYSTATGQLTSISTIDEGTSGLPRIVPDHLYIYGNLGMLVKEGDDVNSGGSLVDASDDRIVIYSISYYKDTADFNGWLRQEKSEMLNTAGNGTSKTVVLDRRTRHTRFNNGAPYATNTRVLADVIEFDSSGRASGSWVLSNNSTRTRTQTATLQPLSPGGENVWQDGYLKSEKSLSGVTKTYAYNSVGLLASVTEGTTNVKTSYTYHTGTKYINTVANTTGSSSTATNTYTYSWSTANNSATVKVTDAAGSASYTEYNAQGLVWRTWGTAAQPTLYTYDSYGRRSKLTTWQNTALTSNFTAATWPASPPLGNEVTWTLDPATGALISKVYPNSSHVDYTYNARGQVKTRTWARGVTTTYNYYDFGVAPFTGQLKETIYSDGTPTVSYTYRRFGAPATINDAAGTRTLSYRNDLQLQAETFNAAFYGAKTLTPTYDTYGRSTGYSFDGSSAATTTIGYDSATGRPNTVSGALGATTASFTLGYAAGTDWVNSVTSGLTYNRATPLRSASPSNAKQNVIASATTTMSSNTVGSFTAGYTDSRGWRNGHTINSSGYATGLSLGGVSAAMSYDGYGQLTVSNSSLNTRDWSWTYDLAGNRKTEVDATGTTTYTPDALDRYSSITGQRQEAGIIYDSDGNLTQDAVWTYAYDGENRLKTLTKSGQTLTFTYDYAGRRIRKTVTGTGAYDIKFLWVGWKLAAELASNGSTVNKTFVWGRDFTDAQGAAGGAGSLLAQISSGAVSYAIPDALGNIVAYANSSGTILASVEYSPYGKGLNATGAWQSYPIGFSSQYMDWEPGIVYYGLRYYAPKHGRFINRDPIEEQGGNNLYNFVGNAPTRRWDVLGLNYEPDIVRYEWVCSGPYSGDYYITQMCVAVPVYQGSTLPTYGVTADRISFDWIDNYRKETLAQSWNLGNNGGSTSSNSSSAGSSSGGGGSAGDPKKEPTPCDKLKAGIDKVGQSIHSAIDSFSDINSYFADANTNAWLSLGQSAGFAAYGITGVVKGIAANAAQTSANLIRTGAGDVPIGIWTSTGRTATVGTAAFAKAAVAETAWRNTSALVIGSQDAIPDVAQYLAADLYDPVSRVLDPWGNLAETQLRTGDALSKQTAATVQQMQGSYKALQELYNQNCR